MRENDIGFGTFLGMIGFIIFIIIFSPFIHFALAYFTGWLIKITFGATFVNGLAIIGLHIPVDSLPLFCGTLGVIGSFFKSMTIKKNEN